MTINDAKLAQLLNDSNFFSLVKECSSCFTSCDRLQEDFDSFTQMKFQTDLVGKHCFTFSINYNG